ncbi:MAG: glycerol-3-phosphate acyltransferase, partial [Clostridia bacterium]|nr:glycerol-3-phosphate acyltransferase [Clostridia bacterium]
MNYQINYGLYYSMYESAGKGPFWLWLVFFLLSVVVAYLLGSINSAIIISKVFYGDDIRKHGSGNAGTTNMLRVYGKKAALFTLIFDMLKTIVAIAFAGFLLGFYYVRGAVAISEVCYIAGLFAVIGHVFPIYYHGKGGKGVLCAATMALILSPIVFVILLAIFVIIVSFTKYVSLGSVVGVGLYPVALRGFMAVLYPEIPMSG